MLNCPLCGTRDASIQHLLHECETTHEWYSVWAAEAGGVYPARDRVDWSALRVALFADRVSHLGNDNGKGLARIRFVGQCCSAAAARYDSSDVASALDELISVAQAGAA